MNNVIKVKLSSYNFFNDFYTAVRRDLASLDNTQHTLALYYLLPLIERLVVEILEPIKNSEIEINSQGRYRTLNGILSNNKDKLINILGNNTFNKIEEIFKENGIRNRVLKDFSKINDNAKIEIIRMNAYYLLYIYVKQKKETLYEKISLI